MTPEKLKDIHRAAVQTHEDALRRVDAARAAKDAASPEERPAALRAWRVAVAGAKEAKFAMHDAWRTYRAAMAKEEQYSKEYQRLRATDPDAAREFAFAHYRAASEDRDHDVAPSC